MTKWDTNLSERWKESEEEPLTGHFERFSQKIKAKKGNNRRINAIISVAAMLVFILLTAGLFNYLREQKGSENKPVAIENELKEAGFYYTVQINKGIGDIEKMAREGAATEEEINNVKKELSSMDNQFTGLEKDYQSNPGDERIKMAIISYYQTKLEIVNIIRQDMENATKQKINYYENNRI